MPQNFRRLLAPLGTTQILIELVVAAGLLGLLTVGFFWQILLTPNAWMPAGGGDLAPFLFPYYRFAADQLRQGLIPLWNPHLYSGAPFAADIQSGVFYPFNLLLFLLVPNFTYRWLEYLAVFHFWLAGVNMYLCLRLVLSNPSSGNRPGPGRLAAFAGALAFEFSDLFIVHFGNLNMIAVAAWLPLVFALFHLTLQRSSWGLAAASGATLGLATLAGHIQITLFILLTLGLYTLYALGLKINKLRINNWRLAIREWRSTLSPLLLLALVVAVTVGVSAIVLFPAYEMSRYTPRVELSYPDAARYSLHPAQMVGLLIPNYFGRDPALHWGPWERVETGYIGVATLLLAVIGAVLGRGRPRDFFTGLAVAALLLALGGYSVLHGWLYILVPGFNQMRAPARFILLLDFSLAALAAYGLYALLSPPNPLARQRLTRLLRLFAWSLGGLIIVAAPLSYLALLVTQDRNPAIFNRATAAVSGVATFALFTVASLVVLYLIDRRRLRDLGAGAGISLLIFVDLFTLGANVDIGHTDPTAGFDHPEAITFLQSDPGLFRIEVAADIWHLWQPNTALLAGLYDAWGLYNPLALADTSLYWQGAPPRSTGRYNFLGVKYIIASKAGAPADGNIISVFDQDPDINIYLNQDALARVLFVGQAVIAPDHDAAWEAIRPDGFNPATTVVLEQNIPDGSPPPQPLDTLPASRLSVLVYEANRVRVGVETDQPGYLVLPDAYYPGWRAEVDGRPAPIRRANYAFRAVYVPAGQHTVTFVFDPPIWKIGLWITILTLAGLGLWGTMFGWRHRRQSWQT